MRIDKKSLIDNIEIALICIFFAILFYYTIPYILNISIALLIVAILVIILEYFRDRN